MRAGFKFDVRYKTLKPDLPEIKKAAFLWAAFEFNIR